MGSKSTSKSSVILDTPGALETQLAGGLSPEQEARIAELERMKQAFPFNRSGFDQQINEIRSRPQGGGGVQDIYNQIAGLVNAGPGMEQVTRANTAQNQLADLLGQYAQSGGIPTQADITQSNQLSQQLYQGQFARLNQAFEDQTRNASVAAQAAGRDLNDPILRAKLAQEQTRQSNALSADVGAYGTQLALQLPQNRLAYQGQQADVLQGLASQALANRSTLLGLGSGLLEAERNFRLQTATRKTETSTGGLGSIIGGIAGVGGLGLQAASAFGAFSPRSPSIPTPSGGGGGGYSAPPTNPFNASSPAQQYGVTDQGFSRFLNNYGR